jgi:hypothetical protein
MGAVKKSRDPLERYDTPTPAVNALMHWLAVHFDLTTVDTVCEPCAGAGNIAKAVSDYFAQCGLDRPRLLLSDIEPRTSEVLGHRVQKLDYLAVPPSRLAFDCADMVITNTPFSLILEIAKQALNQAPVVCLLVRMGWTEGASKKCPERLAFLKETKPAMLVLSKRPSFEYGGPAEFGTYGEKSTDNASYCWLVWGIAPGTWELLGGVA